MKKLALLLIAALLVGYGIFEAWRLIEGPKVTILEPHSGFTSSGGALVVRGEAHNISFLTINDKPAHTDEDGRFEVTLSPPAGYTVVTVAASDRFGRNTSQSVAITALTACPVS